MPDAATGRSEPHAPGGGPGPGRRRPGGRGRHTRLSGAAERTATVLAGGLGEQRQRLGRPEELAAARSPTVLTLNACCSAAASPSETPARAFTGALRISSKLLFSHSLSSTASRFALTGMPIPSACVVLYVGATGNHWPLGDVPYATGPREQAARVDFVARAGQQPSRRSQGGSTRRHGHLPRSARMSRMTSARAGFGCRTNQRRKTTAETTRSTTRSADTSGVYCNAAQTMPVDAIFEIRTWLPAFGHEKSPRERAWGVEGLGW
jgi:hypothetical protein